MELSMVDWRNQFKARGEYWRGLLFAALIGADQLITGWWKIEYPWSKSRLWTLLVWFSVVIGSVILFRIYRAIVGHFKQRSY